MIAATNAVLTTGRLRDRPFARLIAIALLVTLCGAQAIAQNPATSVSVDANANHRPINPNIYGVSYGATYDISTLNAPLNRSGGNATSMYNWQVNALNTGVAVPSR